MNILRRRDTPAAINLHYKEKNRCRKPSLLGMASFLKTIVSCFEIILVSKRKKNNFVIVLIFLKKKTIEKSFPFFALKRKKCHKKRTSYLNLEHVNFSFTDYSIEELIYCTVALLLLFFCITVAYCATSLENC